ncbi:hypothetical protein K8T06_09545, partial [bacterium]|nr:hypothetical protein [bacterium]
MEIVHSFPERWCHTIRPFNMFIVGSDANYIQQVLPSGYLSEREGIGSVTLLPSDDGDSGIDMISENQAVVHVNSGFGNGDPQDLVSIRNTISQYREPLMEMIQGALINVICTSLGDSFPSGVAPV